jgi:hypothetical protein
VTEPKAPAEGKRITPPQAFAAAVDLHRAGRLAEAAQFYRRILELVPAHFGATHYLGLICTQQGRLDEALALLQRAIALDPKSSEARTNLGIALAEARRLDEAITAPKSKRPKPISISPMPPRRNARSRRRLTASPSSRRRSNSSTPRRGSRSWKFSMTAASKSS